MKQFSRQKHYLAFHAVVVTLFVSAAAHARQNPCEGMLVPDVYALNIVPNIKPQVVTTRPALSSPGVVDSWLHLGRRAVADPDFKTLSDLERRPLTEAQKMALIAEAKADRRALYDELVAKGMDKKEAARVVQTPYSRQVIAGLYQEETGLVPYKGGLIRPRLRLAPASETHGLDLEKAGAAFVHVEKTWSDLARQSPASSEGSLIPAPFPFLVAGGRFREAYYWDAYFGAIGLVQTGRWEMAAAQLENMLHMIQVYGLIPNGFRDYYLTRSQPPVIALYAMLIYENAPASIPKEKLREWLLKRVYPLLSQDYNDFWMTQRYDPETGLNFHSDAQNRMRPERHSNDDERALGETFRDVPRGGRERPGSTRMPPWGVLARGFGDAQQLFVLLREYPREAGRAAGDEITADRYRLLRERRRAAMNRYNWDAKDGVFRNYHLRDRRQGEVVSAEMYAAMYVGLASKVQARRMVSFGEKFLERKGGLRSSTVDSGKQWDGVHGWAPFHMMAIEGARGYGFLDTAKRWTVKWTVALSEIFWRTGNFYEKIDVEKVAAPHEDDSKYPTQTGFLWTNASYVWALKFLGFDFRE
ncbi:MAG: hypothetical protein HC902_14425 [Calothrix sp. SM1_5_4]|nr:hypothetical protein [Calothrix sp. SM1_5_4]